jgi:hypothetical protein
MSETPRIIQAVTQLWNDGPELFGAGWPEVRQQLLLNLERLDSHPDEEDATTDVLLAIFDAHLEARDRLVTLLSASGALVKGEYKPLPGQQGAIAASRFVCPDPGCGYTWARRMVGQRIETCPRHHLPLVPVKDEP